VTSSFLDAFEEFVGASGWRTVPSPAQLLDEWAGFVESCEEGYDDNIYEFRNDRSVRDLWGRVLHDAQLRRFEELHELQRAVDRIDERYRRLCRDDVQMGKEGDPWWRRCVPRNAGGELAQDLLQKYGIDPVVEHGQ
jgi:hypothetical protein